MNLQGCRERLARNADAVAALAVGLSSEQVRWQPAPGAWSILEIVNHLADEEREDFRTRLDYVLHRPGEAWPGIDPEGWVRERAYRDRDPAESVDRFLRERAVSVEWLAGLAEPDWDAAWEHPRAGVLRAGDIMASWLAHDLLHLRQLADRHFRYLRGIAAPYSTEYAGTW